MCGSGVVQRCCCWPVAMAGNAAEGGTEHALAS